MSGQVTSVETVKINNRYAYEVEIKTVKGEADVLVDIMSGAILGVEADEKSKVMTPSQVSESRAQQLALQRVPGRATDVAHKYVRGRQAYEIEIQSDRGEADVLVDKETGQVLGVEWD